MHEIQPVVTDVHSVSQSVCLSRSSTWLHCAKTAERIKMLLGMNTLGAFGTVCYTGVLIPPQTGEGIYF